VRENTARGIGHQRRRPPLAAVLLAAAVCAALSACSSAPGRGDFGPPSAGPPPVTDVIALVMDWIRMIASSPMGPPPIDATPAVDLLDVPGTQQRDPARNRASVNVTNQQLLQRCTHSGDRATLERKDQATAHAAVTIDPGRPKSPQPGTADGPRLRLLWFF
jgi:hypothetical protein